MSRLIMHIDMDAFFASVEQQVNPALRGKPLIVGGRDDKYRSVVTAASYEARAYGIDSGMPSWEAFKLCPQAAFVPADSAKYLYTSQKIFEILKEFSPNVEMNSIDEFFLDITGCERLFSPPHQMANKIKTKIKELFGLTCSIGIAPTKLTSKLAASLGKPDGLVIINEEETQKLLKDLPVEKLCGIGERLKEKLNRLGIFTCGELSNFPLEVLLRHFGKWGIWLRQASRIEDVSDIDFYEREDELPKSVGHSYTLRKATCEPPVYKSWLYLLCEMVASRLRHLNLEGRTVCLYLCDSCQSGFSKQKTFFQPTFDSYEIFSRSVLILNLLNIRRLRVRALGVSVSNLSRADRMYLFEHQRRRDRLLRCIDSINDRFGDWTIFPASLALISKKKEEFKFPPKDRISNRASIEI